MTTTLRRWTPLETLTVRAWYQDGKTVAWMAGQLGRTSVATRLKLKRLGLRRCDRHPLSAATVAQVMGLSCPKTVTTWVGRGWLRPIGGRRCRPWRFDALALWDLCANPQTVVAWDGARITDRELRAYAMEQRAQHPRWLRVGEVARRFHVAPVTVTGWVAQGRFASEQVQRYGVLWVQEDALDGFVAPCERQLVRYHCCGRRLPTGAAVPPASHVLICVVCWPDVRMLPGGHLLRLVPPGQDGLLGAEAATIDERRAA